MTFDWQRILESKRAYRRAAASRPIAEKLRTLDDLRERTLAIRNAASHPRSALSIVREQPARYRPTK